MLKLFKNRISLKFRLSLGIFIRYNNIENIKALFTLLFTPECAQAGKTQF